MQYHYPFFSFQMMMTSCHYCTKTSSKEHDILEQEVKHHTNDSNAHSTRFKCVDEANVHILYKTQHYSVQLIIQKKRGRGETNDHRCIAWRVFWDIIMFKICWQKLKNHDRIVNWVNWPQWLAFMEKKSTHKKVKSQKHVSNKLLIIQTISVNMLQFWKEQINTTSKESNRNRNLFGEARKCFCVII